MAEVSQVVSSTLQDKVRQLLPSQAGFGEDLQASNVIVPIVDLTATAEGGGISSDLQQALAFGSQTSFDVVNTTTTLANSPGFWRIFGMGNIYMQASTITTINFSLSDGISSKIIWESSNTIASAPGWLQSSFDFIIFLKAGESLVASSNQTYLSLVGSYRQIATVTGSPINPSGF